MNNPEQHIVSRDVLDLRQNDGTIPRPDLDVLLGDSAHGAYVQEDDGNALWLVKPLDQDKARHERDMYKRMANDGVPLPKFPFSQDPVVEKDDNGNFKLILPFVKGLQPLTRQNWQGYPGMPEFDEHQEVVTKLFGLAAKLHLRGYVHGDFQIKNVGSDSTGKLVLYDLERAEETRRMKDDERERAEADDLISICKSLLINRFLERMEPNVQLENFENYFQHYIAKRKAANFETAFRTVNIAVDKLDRTLHDPEWLIRARERFLASRVKG